MNAASVKPVPLFGRPALMTIIRVYLDQDGNNHQHGDPTKLLEDFPMFNS